MNMARRKRHSLEQIVRKLVTAGGPAAGRGQDLAAVCRELVSRNRLIIAGATSSTG
jgi:hypothetical protein